MRLFHNTRKSNRSGFTLVEIIVTMALMGMVLAIAGSFFNFSTILEKKSEGEFNFQSSMRQASRVLNNSIRDASVTFTLSEEVFSKAKIDEWNYLGIEDGKEIVQYVWNAGTATHDRVVLIPSSSAISYNLYFTQNKPGTKLLEFTLEGIDTNTSNKKLVINSEILAMNSLAVDDGGSSDNPAVAVAYRSDPTPKPEETVTQVPVNMLVALVFDNSGSMGDHMGEGTRLSVLQTEANSFIEDLIALRNVKVSIIPFENDANNPGSFIDCTEANKASLTQKIQNFKAEGGTNTGDGLRRAYHKLQNYKNDPANQDENYVSYVILLTDGNPTYRTSTSKDSYTARTNDGDVTDEHYIFGDGGEGETNILNSMTYVNKIGTTLLAGTTSDIKTFVIGFGSVSGGWTNIKSIAANANKDTTATYYYEADGSAKLNEAFQQITTTMVNQTWHIYGPYPTE